MANDRSAKNPVEHIHTFDPDEDLIPVPANLTNDEAWARVLSNREPSTSSIDFDSLVDPNEDPNEDTYMSGSGNSNVSFDEGNYMDSNEVDNTDPYDYSDFILDEDRDMDPNEVNDINPDGDSDMNDDEDTDEDSDEDSYIVPDEVSILDPNAVITRILPSGRYIWFANGVEEMSMERYVKNIEGNRRKREFRARFPWIRTVNPNDPNLKQKDAQWYIDNRDPDAPELDYDVEEPPGVAFVNNLISIDMDELEPGDRTCLICQEPYLTGDEPEMPLRLPCGHIMGKDCLFTWLTEIGSDHQHDSCPVCRTKHVKSRQTIGTIVGLKQLMRDANYLLLRHGPLRLDREGRERWEDVKRYVQEHLDEQASKRIHDGNAEKLLDLLIREGDDATLTRMVEEFLTRIQRKLLQACITTAVLAFVQWGNENGLWSFPEEDFYHDDELSEEDFDPWTLANGQRPLDDENVDTLRSIMRSESRYSMTTRLVERLVTPDIGNHFQRCLAAAIDSFMEVDRDVARLLASQEFDTDDENEG